MTNPSPAPPATTPISPGGPVTTTETPLDLEAVEARAAAATPPPWRLDGPWWWEDESCTSLLTDGEHRRAVCIQPPETHARREQSRLDFEFIAAARTDVPALIAEVRSLRARVENHHCGGRAAADE
jgi:hypothetical protein